MARSLRAFVAKQHNAVTYPARGACKLRDTCMFPKGSARAPKALVALIAGITLVPLATLLWLGWRLLEQDRVLEQQQIEQRVERAADLITAALHRVISTTEQRLDAGARDWPPGAVAVTFRPGHLEAAPRERVAFWPIAPVLPEAPAAVFAAGEDLEFRARDLTAATVAYRRLAVSPNTAIRAGALLRLGRTLRNTGHVDEALATFARLSELDGVLAGGGPAGLIGSYARCALLDQERSPDLRAAALGLQRGLSSGRWALTEDVYRLYASDAARWTGSDPSGDEREVLASAVSALWQRWNGDAHNVASSGRELVTGVGKPLTLVWNASDGTFRGLIVTPAFVEAQWLTALAPVTREQQVVHALTDPAGKTMFGRAWTGMGYQARRTAAESRLPWSIVTAAEQPPQERAAFALRRRWLVAGLAVVALMALASSYLIVRAVGREVALARLQSEFVADVSHEFRTPLTSLRQFTDMLLEQPAVDGERRQMAYQAQARATARLTRLVESLLDFGRMEAGARRYIFEPRDAMELARAVVDDFRSEARAAGHDVAFSGTRSGAMVIEADDEALTRAVRNLLENAVKYSPTPHMVHVALDHREGEVFIMVRDQGMGIPANELRSVFDKFHRGEGARARGIKGTGIGLAMVAQIVEAHRGRVTVESTPGKGSTFTIALPARQASHAATQ